MYLFTIFLSAPHLHRCSGFSLVAARRGSSLAAERRLLTAASSLAAERGLWGTQASVVAVQGLNHPKGCRIFPDQGSNLHPLNCKVDSYLTTGPPGKPLLFVFL